MNNNAQKTSSSNEELVHLWHQCHNCEAAPIVGKRYHCETCPAGPDNDLCQKCYDLLQKGEIKHPAEESLASALGTEDHQFTIHEGKPGHLFEPWLSVPHPAVPDPKVPHPFVVRPIFCAGLDAAIAGYAFVVNLEGGHPPILLTALHVMDEMIKKKGINCREENKNYTGKELPAVITEVNIYDVFADNWMMAQLGSAGPMLVLPGARIDDEEPYSDRDIAAFWVKEPKDVTPAPLAPQPPSVGDPIWLVARSDQGPGKNLFKTVVVEITDRSMVFKYEKPEEKPKYSSGAPMVNKEGEVVGITVGGGDFKGQKLGHANHVENIRGHLTG
ncbi:MAG: trypsin-like peptidase domain-containing protein [Candidatus Aminicenantes bacterium]|nr:MAG: trypsin-like peptidase domain-containing protein [Candidatus Aminicenantes bacterium]